MRDRYFDSLNFSSVNEDWRTETEALSLGSNDRVLCITGSGDRPLDLLAAAGVRVVAIDVDAAQNHLLELKVVAMKALPFDEYAAFLGLHSAPVEARAEAYARIAPLLSPAAQAYWQRQRQVIAAGVVYQGRFERYFRRVAALGHALRPHAIDQLFTFDDLEEQRRFVRDQWDNAIWRFVFRVLTSSHTSRVLYGDPAYFAHTAMPVGPYIYDRIKSYLERALARDSFMLNLPPYLTRDGVERIRARLDGLQIVTADVVEHMRRVLRGTYTHFSLSDVPSYLSREQFAGLFGAVMRAGAPRARVVVRQFLTRYELPGHLAPYFDREPELEAKLAREDRAFAYEFIIATLRTARRRTTNGSGPTIDELREEDDEEALELERSCIQGESFRLSFRRRRFRDRAETFDDHLLLAARVDGRLVGTAAVAFKDVLVRGEPMRAAFYFDLRVHPDFRGRGIALHLGTEAFIRGFARAELGYYFTVAENRAVLHMTSATSMEDVGGYSYLILPTYKDIAPETHARTTTFDDVHERLLRASDPFDFYTNPRAGGRLRGHVASFVVERGKRSAGCSVWDHRGVLAEVVESLPSTLRVAAPFLRLPLLRSRAPHVPRAGEMLRSWYVFDAFASDRELACDLATAVLREARAQEIDFCHLVHAPRTPWIAGVRDRFPHAFAPILSYRLLGGWRRAGRFPQLTNVYVDIRDL
jgi:S-adenosylmethionine-diacylglycerol 3-amino-3-carboxypropyl transferase